MEDKVSAKSLGELGLSNPVCLDSHVLAYCLECGATQEDNVTVEAEAQWNRLQNPNKTISEDQHVTFRCDQCQITETAESGLFPERLTENFATRNTGETTDLHIDNSKVHYRSIDEQVIEGAYIKYDDEEITTSRVHHVHIHALNPPTLSKNSAHQIAIEDYLDQDMMLVGIGYHSSKHRTLKFVRGLDKGVLKKLEEIKEG